MEETIYINFDPNLNGALTTNVHLCPTWEVVTSEEFSLPLYWNTEPEQSYSAQEVLDVEKQNLESYLYKKKNCCIIPRKSKKCFTKEKVLAPDCKCPCKCFKKIGEETICKIFNDFDFWALSDYNSQNAYLFELINLVGVKRHYSKNKMSRQDFTIVYHVKDNGQNVPMCKKPFLNIHGLQRNRGRISNLTYKMKEGESVPPPDKWVHHTNRPNVYSKEAIEHVLRYLLRCPRKDQKKNSSKPSKHMVFSTKWCCALYVNEYCKSNELTPVSLDKFRRVFAVEVYTNMCKEYQKSKKLTEYYRYLCSFRNLTRSKTPLCCFYK